jgi:hypothetical protein
MVVDSASLGGSPIAPATNAYLSGYTPAAVAVDGAGNVYAANGTSILESISGTTYTLPSLTATPSQIAVDPTGNIFAVNSASSTITELQVTKAGVPATYATTSVSYTPSSGTAAPQAIATDQFGNLYVADYQSSDASAVYRLSWSPLTQTYQNQVTIASGLNNPASLAVDASGNVFIADKSAGEVYEYSPSSALTYSLANTYTVTSPDAVAVDPGGDVYVQTGSSVVEIPVSGPVTTVLTGLSSPVGLAVDGLGNVYSADASTTSITQVVRNAASANFGVSETTAYAATLTNAGNLVTATPFSTTLANIDLAAGSGTGCSVSNSLLSAMTAGQACTISAEMIGAYSTSASGAMTAATNILEFTPTTSTIGSLQFSGTLPAGQVYSTTTSISGQTPASPIYSASGTEATFTVTVAATVPPTNTVYVTVDMTTTGYTLNSSGQATVYVTGLKACSTNNCHTISATYYTNGFYTGSISGSTAFNVAQSTTSASWSPAATTQQVSAAIGTTGVLNPAATTTDSSVTSLAGNFAYTATCTSTVCPASYPNGIAVGIDASTYLPIGTYTLTATFIPIDTTDYSSASSVQVTGYTVTQATTAASVGATTMLVASSGGNYTTLSAALAALPVTGGTVYLAPGTYTGQNAISYPNVYLRGLGGDPTKIILTAANGNFNLGSYPQSSGTVFGPGPAGKAGDEGSATLDVSKNGYPSGSSSPYGFYAEYLTIQNTYDTDPVTTSTTTASGNGGTCIFNPGGTAYTLQYLYNNNLSCGAQAQALFMNADQAILNNVNLTSQQDTLYAGYQGTAGSTYVPSRQYIWKGLITGDVDYIYGDAALVLDHTNIFTTWHGTTATGTETITAQNKRAQTGGSGDYLSGYVCNACTLMSQTSTANGGAMTNLYYGRPYGTYSTFVLLNSQVDQVNAKGWVGWDGASQYLNTSTYAEYNTKAYIDPAVGTAPYPSILFYPTTGAGGVIPSGGNIGTGVIGTRESSALALTAGTAAPYYPVNFLSNIVSTTGGYTGMPTTWNPVTALAARVNAFASTGAITTVASGSSVTILGRPQTPGAGFVPTGTYQFLDSVNGAAATVMTNGSGSLDASGEAYLTTSSLATGTHSITFAFATGDGNFASSTSTTPYILNVTGGTQQASTVTVTPAANAIYGSSASATITVAASSGTTVPTGTLLYWVDSGSVQTVTLSGAGTYNVTLASPAAGTHTLHTVYEGDANFLGNTATGYLAVARAILQITATKATMVVGGTVPTSFAYTITGYVNGDTSSVLSGAPAISTTATSPAVIGEYPITVTTGTLAASNYTFAFTGAYLYVTGTSQAAAVATGDSRTVTEPSFPAVCQQLNADITQLNNDIPASVDTAATPLSNANLINPTVTNPDGGRIQAALNACSASYPGSGPGLSVELSVDGAGNNAFLTGPLIMPSNVTLLVDPGVVLFFSRNAQDYDKVAGTHTCGTINTSSATSSCLNLIDIPKTSTNVGIMGYGKLDGRGGDTLINAIAPYQGYSWWGLSAAYASPNSQQNPRWIEMESGSSNITLYKITLRNAPLFHVATGGAVSNFTAWDIKIITPTTSRNTDGIDPGNVTNVTITRSWISDGDDNVAVGASGTTAPASNISVTNNHFYAGHGQSFGSFTGAGISNVLWDGNMASGNGFANIGSASITGTADSNSTGIRIKTANDRGGLVTGIQYSNECLLDHKADIQFTPYYSSGDSTNELPNYQNILMQNVVFMNDASTASAGTVELTGEFNTNLGGTPSPVINPLHFTLDNVTFPSALSSLVNSTTPVETTSIWSGGNYSGGTGQYAALTYGPGAVSTNFITAYASLASVSANNDTVTNNITASSLNPPSCTFTYIAPELTGPTGLPQTITQGQNATAVVILTPAVGGAAYPTGTVTLIDALTSSTYTATLPGTTDTISIPLSGLSVGTHTLTAAYSGDTNYVGTAGVYTTTSPYVITVNAGSLSATTTSLGLPVSTSATSSYGTAITATATVTGVNPTGSVQFVVSGGGLTGSYTYATVALTSGTASASINLPYNAIAYSITAVYSGDLANAGSTSSVASLTVGAAVTQTTLTVNTASAALGNPFILTATVTSTVGTPAVAPVNFAYSTTLLGAQTTLGTATTNSNGVTTYYLNSLPVGSYYLFASFAGVGSYGSSTSTPGIPITVTAATNIVQLSSNPIALPYTITTIAGGGAAVPSSGNMVCTGATDKYGDGCQATAMAFTSGDDMRAVTADPSGNVYLTDISATRVRRIAPNGVITTFAGGGSTCTPPATTSALGSGCTPTAAALSKPRGVGSDAAGNVFIADYSSDKVFEVKAADGLMYLVAGTGTATSTGDGGPATSATVNTPRGAWGDSLGNIYIAETGGYRIRVVDTAGNIHTFAGTGTNTSTGDGAAATAATISNPQGVFVDANLNVYVADSIGKIRVICVTCGNSSPLDKLLQAVGATTTLNSATNGYIYTIAGNGSAAAYTGTYPILATSVSMAPQKLSMDNSGNLYISDSNGFVWFLDFHTGYLRAIAVNGTVCTNKTDSYGDGCPATQANFGSNGGNGLGAGVDTQGNLYISDSTNGLIRKVITGLASPATAVNATTTLPVQIHFVAGDTIASSNGLAYTSSEWTLGTPACTPKVDTTTDCLLTSSFTPAVSGARSTPLTVNSSAGNKANLTLSGIGLGITITSYLPAAPVFGQSVTVSATVTGSTLLTPTGTVAFYLDGSSTAAASGTHNGSGVATGSLTALSTGLHSVIATYTSSNGYPTASTTVSSSFTVGKANPTLAWATPAAITYGTALSGTQLNATATGVTGATLPGVFTYSPLSGVVLTGGTQTLSVSFAPTDITDYTTPATTTVSLQVNKVLPTITLVSSLNPMLLQNPVTYTATVSSTAGKPTGTVAFSDGGTVITACASVTVTTATGQANCAVTYTVTGTHSITAVYSGDTNFLVAGPSNTVSEAAIDINLGSPTTGGGTTSSETILPGGAATYLFPIAPSSGTTFPLPVTFTVNVTPALPSGTTMALTPSAWVYASNNPWSWTLPASTSLAGTTVLTIQLPQATASAQPAGGNLALHLAPFSLALLLLPFAGRLRKSGKRLGRMLAIVLLAGAGAATLAGLSGCGSNTGFFAQSQHSYTVTVTVGSGSLSHTSTVTLTVE